MLSSSTLLFLVFFVAGPTRPPGSGAFDLQDPQSIEAAVNASVADLHKTRFSGGLAGLGRHHAHAANLSATPPGLDGALAAAQAASEARCRNLYTAQPEFIRWTSHATGDNETPANAPT